MKQYLYIFGFNTPLQVRHNTLLRDDEDSECVVITAGSEEEALEWGREISERFVRELFEDSSVSWKVNEFAHWVEDDPVRIDAAMGTGAPVIKTGQFPDLQRWIKLHHPR